MNGGKKERYVYDTITIDVRPDLQDLKSYCNHVAENGWRVVQVIDMKPRIIMLLVERKERV